MRVIGIRFATCTPMTYEDAIAKGYQIGSRGIGCKPDAPGYIVDYGYGSTLSWWDKDLIDSQFYNIDGMTSDNIADKVRSLVSTYKFNAEFTVSNG